MCSCFIKVEYQVFCWSVWHVFLWLLNFFVCTFARWQRFGFFKNEETCFVFSVCPVWRRYCLQLLWHHTVTHGDVVVPICSGSVPLWQPGSLVLLFLGSCKVSVLSLDSMQTGLGMCLPPRLQSFPLLLIISMVFRASQWDSCCNIHNQ